MQWAVLSLLAVVALVAAGCGGGQEREYDDVARAACARHNAALTALDAALADVQRPGAWQVQQGRIGRLAAEAAAALGPLSDRQPWSVEQLDQLAVRFAPAVQAEIDALQQIEDLASALPGRELPAAANAESWGEPSYDEHEADARRRLVALAQAKLVQQERRTDLVALARLLDVLPCDDPGTLAPGASPFEIDATSSSAVATWWCNRGAPLDPYVADVVEDEVAYGMRTFAEEPERVLALADGRRETYRDAALDLAEELRAGACPAREGVQALMGFADGSITL